MPKISFDSCARRLASLSILGVFGAWASCRSSSPSAWLPFGRDRPPSHRLCASSKPQNCEEVSRVSGSKRAFPHAHGFAALAPRTTSLVMRSLGRISYLIHVGAADDSSVALVPFPNCPSPSFTLTTNWIHTLIYPAPCNAIRPRQTSATLNVHRSEAHIELGPSLCAWCIDWVDHHNTTHSLHIATPLRRRHAGHGRPRYGPPARPGRYRFAPRH